MVDFGVALAGTLQDPVKATGIVSTQAQALAGTDNTTIMTPLRVAEVFTSVAPPTIVADRTALAALDTTKIVVAEIKGNDGRQGWFLWVAGNFSAQVTADPQQGVYVASSANPTGSTGVWIRQRDNFVSTSNFGAVGNGTSDDYPAFAGALSIGVGLTYIPPPPTAYNFNTLFNTQHHATAWLPDPSIPWAALTDSGQFSLWRGRVTGLGIGSNIWRFSDRVFVGAAASQFAGDTTSSDAGNSWLSDPTTAPAYLGINASLLVTTGPMGSNAPQNTPYGIVSGVRSSDAGSGIAFGAALVHDTSGAAWAHIAELQREAGAGQTIGFEFGAKNKGDNQAMGPNAQTNGVFGSWYHAGGDDSQGGVAVNPATAAIVVLGEGTLGVQHTWNTGIVFMKDALSAGSAISMSSEAYVTAHRIDWTNAAGNSVFWIRSSRTLATRWQFNNSDSGIDFVRDGKNALSISEVASAVNGLTVTSSGTGVAVTLSATGDDTNIDLILKGKGSGGAGLQDGGGTYKVRTNTTGIGFNGTSPIAKPAVTGALSTVTDAAAKATITSILTALTNYGLTTNSTT